MIVTAIAVGIVVASIPLALVAWLRTRSLRSPLGLTLDLWVAAGLLRLSQEASWQRIAAAAIVIAVRKLVVHGLERPALANRSLAR